MGFNASPFSGRNTSVSASANKNVHPILNDRDVLSLERLLRVKSKVELRLPGRLLDPPPVSVPLNQAGGCNEIAGENERITGLLEVDTFSAVHVTAGESERITGFLEVATVSAAHVTAGESKRVTGLLEVDTVSAAVATAGDSERITELLEVDTVLAADSTAGDSERIHGLPEAPQLAEVGGAAETAAHATAGDSEGIIGLCVSQTSFGMPINSLNSSGCVAAVACARLPAVPGFSATASSSAFPPASLAVVVHARSTPMHSAHNSWSDTVRLQGSDGHKEGQRVGFPVRAKICVLSQRWRQGLIFGRPAVYGSRL